MNDKDKILNAIELMIEDRKEKQKECDLTNAWERRTMYRHKGATDVLKVLQRFIEGLE